MLYLSCPTCGYFLGIKTQNFENEKKKICSNPNLSIDEREKQISELIKSLNLRRYCCKMRVMSYKDIVDVVLPINE